MLIECPKCGNKFNKRIDIYNLYGSYKEVGESYEKEITELFNTHKHGDKVYFSEVIECPECDEDLEISIELIYNGITVKSLEL